MIRMSVSQWVDLGSVLLSSDVKDFLIDRYRKLVTNFMVAVNRVIDIFGQDGLQQRKLRTLLKTLCFMQ